MSIAEKLADYFFTDGRGGKVRRLVLEANGDEAQPAHRLAGWGLRPFQEAAQRILDEAQSKVFLLWEDGAMQGVITDAKLAQEWADSKETRGFTLELLNSPLRRETILFKMGKGQSKTAKVVQSKTSD